MFARIDRATLRRRAAGARSDAVFLRAMGFLRRGRSLDDPEPGQDRDRLEWAPAHPVLLDRQGGAYHREGCPWADDQQGGITEPFPAGAPLPRTWGLNACPHCRPELLLVPTD